MRATPFTLAVALVLILVGSAGADTITIQPSNQDAFVDEDVPNRINGAKVSHNRIRVLQHPQPRRKRGLVQFDLSPIPNGATVSSAVVELNQASGNVGALTHGLHRINASWLETSTKWNTQPVHNAVPSATATVGTGPGFKIFTVTADVQAFVNFCTDNRGWMVRDQNETADNNAVAYTSSEAVTGELPDRPKITVTFTPPPCATNADCADTNLCTTNERCESGVCVVDQVSCDDSNPCTSDICDCGIGCINSNICDDGFTCTTDFCDPDDLSCSYTFSDAVCTSQCATGTCEADQDNGDLDPITGCTVEPFPNGTGCTDGDLCTTGDACDDGECAATPVVCTPLSQCHDAGTCNPLDGSCSNPVKPPGALCNDATLCTAPDECDGAGNCVGGNPVVCTPLSQCHDAGTCNPLDGLCSNPPKSNGEPCDDATLCTGPDACDGGGTCVGANPVVCTPLSQCHDAGTCNPSTGLCSDPPKANGEPCDDGTLCTSPDTCDGAGGCVGANPVVCTPLSQCHDAGTCNASTGICSDPPKGSGEPCVDGDACTQTDECDGAGACVGANPVVCTPLDQCHVAGTCDTGTGLCSNPQATNGIGCDDTNTCTINDACLNGVCQGDPTTCGDNVVQASCGEECDDPLSLNCTPQCQFVCGPTPEPGCKTPAVAKKGTLVVQDKSPDKRDKLLWRWSKGAATTVADFGDPLATTRYTLCLYDESANAQPVLFAIAPPGGLCAGKPCWKAVKGGFKYRDRDLDPDGVAQILLKSGAAGAAKVFVKGQGVNLPTPLLPLSPTVTIQLISAGGLCWEDSFTVPIKNQFDQFKAKSD